MPVWNQREELVKLTSFADEKGTSRMSGTARHIAQKRRSVPGKKLERKEKVFNVFGFKVRPGLLRALALFSIPVTLAVLAPTFMREEGKNHPMHKIEMQREVNIARHRLAEEQQRKQARKG